jgi:hypothetical protein
MNKFICGASLAAAIILCSFLSLEAFSNPEIVANLLGEASKACAQRHCDDKDSLDLWMEIGWDCHKGEKIYGGGAGYPEYEMTSTTVQALQRRLSERSYTAPGRRKLFEDSVGNFLIPRYISGILCGLCAVIGMLVGIQLGRKYLRKLNSTFAYQTIPSTDDHDSIPVAVSVVVDSPEEDTMMRKSSAMDPVSAKVLI